MGSCCCSRKVDMEFKHKILENEMWAGCDILDAILNHTIYILYYMLYYILYYTIYIYGDVIFGQACNKSFHESLESLQYHSLLAATRAKSYFKEKTLPLTRFRISSGQALVCQTLHFL